MKFLNLALFTSLLMTGCAMRGTHAGSSTPVPSGPVRANTDSSVIPAGTTLAVRTNERITSEDATRRYTAEVAQDIVDANGNMLVPKGSPAELSVLEINDSRLGTKTLALAVRSVTVNGRRYQVLTDEAEQRGADGLGANKRTAAMVGGGAVLGTLLGAAIGGGAGAAAGAAVGAAGGATAQVLTRGEEVRVPAETILTFRLEQPWRLAT